MGPDFVGVVKLIDGRVRDKRAALRRGLGYYDRLVVHYKALRHLYRYMTHSEFVSPIDSDGDWVMGYRTVTYRMP